MSQAALQLDMFDPLAETRPPQTHRVLHMADVRLIPHTEQIWPPCVADMDDRARIRNFGNLPRRAQLFTWEVADFFQVSSDTVYRWIYDGTVVAVNLARDTKTRPDYRILRASVIEFYMRRMEGI